MKKTQDGVANMLQSYGYNAWKEAITSRVDSSIKAAVEGYQAADAKYGLSDRIAAAKKRVAEVDSKYAVSDSVIALGEKAQKIGDEYSGNRVTPIVEKGKEMITEGYNAVQEKIAAATSVDDDTDMVDAE